MKADLFLCDMTKRMHSFQELCNREEALTRATLQHKLQEEHLRERERELHLRELSLIEKEIAMHVGESNKPAPAKRKNRFSRSKVAKLGGISEPTGKTIRHYCQ